MITKYLRKNTVHGERHVILAIQLMEHNAMRKYAMLDVVGKPWVARLRRITHRRCMED